MRTRKLTFARAAEALALATLGLAGSQAFAAEYWLKAAATTVQMPNPNGTATTIGVPMWGYASCPDGSFGATVGQECGPVLIPGPALTVASGDLTGLTVHLKNSLSPATPTSLVINGLIKPMAPVWTDGTTGPRGNDLAKRVRSFDSEASPGGGEATYLWSNVPPGTYLYQSGTQPQVQVQMGLYGAVTKNFADATVTPTAAQAYSGVPYDNQATLLYSEIDPALHTAVATGKYGAACPPATPDCGNPTSTFNYTPKYFLVNGQPYPYGTPVISPAGNPGTTLLRMLNAGLMTHVPMIQGTHWTAVAEDGKPYSYRRNQYTALLPAAKTLDLLLTPESGGVDYRILDRRLSLSNAGVSNGGMLAVLRYGAIVVDGGGSPDNNQAPVALDDTYSSVVGVTLNVSAPDGVLMQLHPHPVTGLPSPDYDPDNLPLSPVRAVATSGSSACTGTYSLEANGSFSYTPPAAMPAVLPAGCTATSDSFNYQNTDGKALSALATVTINLTTPGAPALTPRDDFTRTPASQATLGTNWSQQVGGDPPATDIGVNAAGAAVANGTALGGLALWNTSFGTTQGAGATLSPNGYLVLKATVDQKGAPVNFIRVGCEGGQFIVATMMGGSNVSVYVKQAAFGTCSGTVALRAVVDVKGLVTVFQGTTFRGGVQLPDVAAWKGGGRIGIQFTATGATADLFAGGAL